MPWGDASLTATWRHIGSVDLVGATQSNINTTLEERNYLDLFLRASLRENIGFRFGVNNVFDKNPPGFRNANVYV